MNSVGEAAAGYQPTEDLQRLQHRTSFIIQDMDALGRICSVEAAAGFHTPTSSKTRIRGANSQGALIWVTACPEGIANHMDAPRLWPFLQGHLQRHRATERRRMIRSAAVISGATHEDKEARAAETVEDASSATSDVRLKSKTRTHHHHQAQKCVTACHHEVSWCRLNLSAPLHQHVVVTQNYQIKCETSPTRTRTADFAGSLPTSEPGRHSGGCAGVCLGEARNPGQAEHERDHTLKSHARRKEARDAILGAKTPSLEGSQQRHRSQQ